MAYPDPDIIALDNRFRRYIIFNTVIRRHHFGTLWAEGPAWNGVGRYLVWSDIPNNVQMRWIEDDGRVATFRNPSGASSTGTTAGALIDAAGLKGYRVGDAAISEIHANFIVNLGAATAADALACIRAAHEAVRERFGVRLEPEVQLIGFSAAELAFLEAA